MIIKIPIMKTLTKEQIEEVLNKYSNRIGVHDIVILESNFEQIASELESLQEDKNRIRAEEILNSYPRLELDKYQKKWVLLAMHEFASQPKVSDEKYEMLFNTDLVNGWYPMHTELVERVIKGGKFEDGLKDGTIRLITPQE